MKRLPSKIPSGLVQEVMNHYAKGETGQQIASWLLHTHRINCCVGTVRDTIERVRQERAPLAEEILREKLQASIGSDLEILGRTLKRLDAISTALSNKMESDVSTGNLEACNGRTPRAVVLASVEREKLAYLVKSLEISGVTMQNNCGSVNNGVQIVLPPEELPASEK